MNRTLTSALALFSLSVLAGAVHAQSNIKIYGTIDTAIGQYQLAGANKIKAVGTGDMVTSFIGFSGSEDLGGGLKATFALESFLRSDSGEAGRFNGDNFWARAANVGLTGSFGSLKVGRTTNLTFLSALLFNSFGDSFGFSPTIIQRFIDARGAAASIQGDTGWSNSVTYSSPSFGGFSAAAQVAAAEGNGKQNTGAHALYFGGPFSATVSWQSVGVGLGGQKETTTGVGAAYDFGPVKLYGQYTDIDDKASVSKVKISNLSLSAPVGPMGKFMAAWGQSKISGGSTHTTTSIGYDHMLSKRTDIYAVYMNDKVTSLKTGNTMAVGLKHNF
ncbi:MAG: porin [Burkholderiales bacterium]